MRAFFLKSKVKRKKSKVWSGKSRFLARFFSEKQKKNKKESALKGRNRPTTGCSPSKKKPSFSELKLGSKHAMKTLLVKKDLFFDGNGGHFGLHFLFFHIKISHHFTIIGLQLTVTCRKSTDSFGSTH
jgi:hypothetical protein